jgi:hypothetical protein
MKKWIRWIASVLMFGTLGYTLLSMQSKQSAFMFGLPYPSFDAHVGIGCACILSCIIVLLVQPKKNIGVLGVIASTTIAFFAFIFSVFLFFLLLLDTTEF